MSVKDFKPEVLDRMYEFLSKYESPDGVIDVFKNEFCLTTTEAQEIIWDYIFSNWGDKRQSN